MYIDRIVPLLLLAVGALPVAADDLDETRWRLSQPPSGVALPAKAAWYVSFERGRVAFKACNTHSGVYRVEGERIVIDRMISTLMACIPDAGEPEKALLAMAGSNPQFAIDGSTLTLTGAGKTWTFSREKSAAEALDNSKWVLKEPKVPAPAVWTAEFQQGRVFWKACNTHSGSYHVENDRLVSGGLISTMMACTPSVAEPERLLLAMVSGKPRFRLEGPNLILTGPDGAAWSFVKEQPAVAKVEGARWVLRSSPPGVTLPTGAAWQAQFENGRASFKACNTHTGPFVVERDRLVFGNMVSTRMVCPSPAAAPERAFLATIAGKPQFRQEGSNLTLTGASGAWTFEKEQPVFNALDHTKWILREAPAGITVPPQCRWSVLFDKGRVSLTACNTHNGAYNTEVDRLVVGRLASTMRACLPDVTELEKALLNAVTGKPQYRVDGSDLTLASPSGTWRFAKEPLPSDQAVTRFIYVASETLPCTAGVMKTNCFQIRETKDEPWRLNYTPIIGFDFHPGTEYRLRIKEDRVANPPADGSSVVWFLDLVVEQRLVTVPPKK